MTDSIVALPLWHETTTAKLLIASANGTEIAAERPFSLCEADSVQFIARGFVDVFAISNRENQRVPQRHLARFEANDLIFCCRTSNGKLEQGTLIAVPHNGTKLVPLNKFSFEQAASDPLSEGQLEQPIQTWVSKLLQSINQQSIPTSILPIQIGQAGRLFDKDHDYFWKGLGLLHELIIRNTSEMHRNNLNSASKLRQRIDLDQHVLKAANSNLAAVLKSGHPVPEKRSWVQPTGHSVSEVRPPNTAKREMRRPNERSASSTDATHASPDPLWEACRLVVESLGIIFNLPKDVQPATTTRDKLQQICDSSHLHSRGVLLRNDWWRRDNGPLVGFISGAQNSDSHSSEQCLRPVALLPHSEGYRLVDPETEATRIVDKSLAKNIDEKAFMLYPTSVERALKLKALVGAAIHQHWHDLLIICAMALACGLLTMMVPIVIGVIYGKIIPNGYRGELTQLILALLAAALGACGFQITRALSVLRLTGKLDLELQPLLWGRLLALPAAFFRRYTVGDLADRVQGIGIIRQILLADVTTTILALVTSLTSFALLYFYSWRLAFLATGSFAALVAVTVILALHQLKYRHRAFEARGRISSVAFALVQGLSKLRTSGAEIRSYGVWAETFASQSHHVLHAERFAGFQAGVNAFYLLASEIALFGLMGFRVYHTVSVGSFIAFSAAFGQIQAALLTFITLIPELLVIFPIYKRLRPILEEPSEDEEENLSFQLCGDVEVRDITFKYHEQGPLVLDRVSFKAARGEFVAIVGPSGSGKSTLIRLLLGFERPGSGLILYDNADLTSLNLKSVRRQIGTVLQNSKPITGDILSNIVGCTNNDIDSAWEAARIAGIDEEIKAMPMGMHTMIGEGATTFSGGERQRLMIARAVANRPRIILLDEATSALDSPTQNNIQRCLEEMKTTRIVVAHRLSTVRNANRIYVLDGGRIVECGRYDDLCEKGGYFAAMAARQI